MKLSDDSRVAIIGGGPAGSMTGFFLLELADRIGLRLTVDLYEKRDFNLIGPPGCNMCAGVVSESLVQVLAAEGINLPPLVVQRGIDSYVLHTSGLNPVAIEAPSHDLRIATVYRGSGPERPMGDEPWASFDKHLLELAQQRGVNVLRQRVTEIERTEDGLPVVIHGKDERTPYDFLVGAVGVNSSTMKIFEGLGFEFRPPPTSKGFLSEIYLGQEQTREYLGTALHIFLLDIPRLKFAAIIPKAEYVTVCLLGKEIDREVARHFLSSPEVRNCFPADLNWCYGAGHCEAGEACHCAPKLAMGAAHHPYGDRVALVGDSAVSRLYKDGIGAAYITAKSLAATAIFLGISSDDFKRHYWPVVRGIHLDNHFGRAIFAATKLYQKFKFLRRGMVRMVQEEHGLESEDRIMSRVLWDAFTGSATYRNIFFRTMTPAFGFHLARATFQAATERTRERFGGE
ncbi:MAG: hypothetical protein HQL51_13670 [Magnetococcales bacterium]|nr:hypothetical protein [Magnetococcales bacterium]